MNQGPFAFRRVWARLSYESGWLRKLRYLAALTLGVGMLAMLMTGMKLQNLNAEADYYKKQALIPPAEPALSPEEEASQRETAAIIQRYEKAANPKSFAVGLLSLSAQQYRLQVNAIEISEQVEESLEESLWKPRLFRLRLNGKASDLQMWLELLEKLPIIIAPSGLQVTRKVVQEQSSSSLEIILECQVWLPETDDAQAGGKS